jgi:hypothetical protein
MLESNERSKEILKRAGIFSLVAYFSLLYIYDKTNETRRKLIKTLDEEILNTRQGTEQLLRENFQVKNPQPFKKVPTREEFVKHALPEILNDDRANSSLGLCEIAEHICLSRIPFAAFNNSSGCISDDDVKYVESIKRCEKNLRDCIKRDVLKEKGVPQKTPKTMRHRTQHR